MFGEIDSFLESFVIRDSVKKCYAIFYHNYYDILRYYTFADYQITK
jgi:hypothetical protein